MYWKYFLRSKRHCWHVFLCYLWIHFNFILGSESDHRKQLSRRLRQLPTEINIQVTAPLFSSRLFDYGTEFGDRELAAGVDVGKRVQLTQPITFFGKKHDFVHILSNGAIGFEESSRNYQTSPFPSATGLIAPFWNRNDLRKGGRVYYREVTDGRLLERGESEIRYQYDKIAVPKSAFIVTWEHMQPLSKGEPLEDQNTNTFQAVLFATNNGTFANFIYKNIGWTRAARAGFNKGSQNKFYELPTSGGDNIVYLEDFGNTGIPGEWMFQLDMPDIIRCKPGTKGDTCDVPCAKSEWGYDCANCCHCSGGRCNPSNGHCAGGTCLPCWTGPPTCQQKDPSCPPVEETTCAHNAISFTEPRDQCAQPVIRCQCLSGYAGDGHTRCDDIDECAQTTYPCSVNAQCYNTPGRYYCECLPGYTGDGTQCTAAFLYPYAKHQALPKTVDANIPWRLRQPMTIFGKPRSTLTITGWGIIALDDVPNLSFDDPLEIQETTGFAPFFGRIDSRKGGTISVAESTESDVLTRATKNVAEHFGEKNFIASSVLTVTYENVTSTDGKPGNTFQANVIGGNSNDEEMSFVEFLYKDLHWSKGAQASIMTEDARNTLVLPGSGTEGLVQLAKLSNVHSPGQWLFRVDKPTVASCPHFNLQPPYCDQPARQAPSFTTTTTRAPSTQRITTRNPFVFASKTEDDHRTITFPPFITVIPQLLTPARPPGPGAGRTNFIFPAGPNLGPIPEAQTRPSVFFSPSTSQRPRIVTGIPTQQFSPRLPVFPRRPTIITAATRKPDGPAVVPTFRPAPDYADMETSVERSTDPPLTTAPPAATTRKATKPPRIPEQPKKSSEEYETDFNLPPIQILKATTTSRPRAATTARRLVTAKTTRRPLFITAAPRKTPKPPRRPFDAANGRNFNKGTRAGDDDEFDSPSRLAIVIPTAIVGVWLLLLCIIGLVVCCRRRQTRKDMRSKYEYRFQHMPMGQHPAPRVQKERLASYPAALHASYEDHLEKAARMSEMTQHNHQNNGRLSLYGSYWNVPGSSGRLQSSSSYDFYNQGYYESCPEFHRYAYGSRY